MGTQKKGRSGSEQPLILLSQGSGADNGFRPRIAQECGTALIPTPEQRTKPGAVTSATPGMAGPAPGALRPGAVAAGKEGGPAHCPPRAGLRGQWPVGGMVTMEPGLRRGPSGSCRGQSCPPSFAPSRFLSAAS